MSSKVGLTGHCDPQWATCGSPEPALLPDLIAQQVLRSPDAAAVVDTEATLSYAELSRHADRIAARLRHYRVHAPGQEMVVAVGMHRSVDLVVALLGVWRAGMAYLPLDPEHPTERLKWQLADSRARLVLTNRAVAGAFDSAGVETLCLDDELHHMPAVPDFCPARVLPDSAAYVIYTSGSTGTPKGVVITHAGIANRVMWTVREHRLSTADRVLQKTAITFDAAGWEVFAPLVSGGTTVMAPVAAERDPTALLRAVVEQSITVLQMVPSALRLMIDQEGWRSCQELRLVCSAGEPLTKELCERLQRAATVELWNTYGPTECSIDVSGHRFDPDRDGDRVPIGHAIDNVRLQVLDPDGAPVAPGGTGELYVGGVALARGYLGRPALTAESFVPNPSGPPGARAYRTGDLVQQTTDGALEYVGRRDNQVKVNGVRIDPAEIETVLLRQPGVRNAAVKSVGDRYGRPQLVAFLDTADPSVPDTATPESLRAALRVHLPEPFIPSTFVRLDQLPLTASGKVDRRALPDPDLDSHRLAYVAPRTPEERLVAGAWSELLERGDVGIHDDFFQLGGSSLQLTQLARRLSGATGKRVSITELFNATSVEAQACLLSDQRPELVPIRRQARDRPLPLSFGQRRQWFLDRLTQGTMVWSVPMFLRLPSYVDEDTLRQALHALAMRHESLRTSYVTDADGEPVQLVTDAAEVPVRTVRELDVDLSESFRQELEPGFDLTSPPLARALLVQRSTKHQLLLLAVHHIATDARSCALLERDLRELLAALAAGRPPDLPALPVQYAEFASWQREQLTDAILDTELSFWRKELAALPQLRLPLDRPRPAAWDNLGGVAPLRVPSHVADRVLTVGREQGATPFMTLLTALAVTLSRFCGQEDVPITAQLSGRTHPQTEDVVGFFLNTLVIRCNVAGSPSFRSAVDRVRDTCAAAFAHSRVPFDRLVDELAPVRDPGQAPLHQIGFELAEQATPVSGLDPDDLEKVRQAWHVAKADLCLYLYPKEDGSLAGVVEYARALFDHHSMKRFAKRFQQVLAAVASEPDTPLPAVGMLEPAEREQLLGFAQPTLDPSSQLAAMHGGLARQIAARWATGANPAEPVRVQVLDRYGDLAPIGIPGEIHVTVADALDYEATGDLGCRRPDGRIEVLGRVGDEVRFRGRWVDTREVERVLIDHESVADVAVIPTRPATGPEELCAYWVAAADSDQPTASAADLTEHCRAALAPFQCPSTFIQVRQVLRLADGGVDRAALLSTAPVAQSSEDADDDDGALRELAEQRIGQIWAEVLRTDVDADESFFALGGNSVDAMTVLSRVQEQFGVEVPVHHFFRHPTVTSLAKQVVEIIRAEVSELSDAEVAAALKL